MSKDDDTKHEPHMSNPIPPPLPERETENRTQTLRTRMTAVRDKIRGQISDYTRTSIRGGTGLFRKDFDRTALTKWMTRTLARQVESDGVKFWSRAFGILFSVWFLSDFAGLLMEQYLPDPPPQKSPTFNFEERRTRGVQQYEAIYARNLFNSKGLIPGVTSGQPDEDLGGTPTRTNLPFNLVGTVILHDELRSLGTIEDKSAQAVYPVRVNDEIPTKARIVKVEANQVIFVNLSTGRREFIDMPVDPALSTAQFQIRPAGTGGAQIEQQAPNQFSVPKAEVDKALADFNQVLTQARAVPNFENGVPAGFKLFQIVPGSIYSKLGLKDGDNLLGINGESINDVSKAFTMLNELKAGANHLELQVKRNGRTNTFVYDIR